MNILDALKQLRDDIKTWATNNFKALENKIEESTLPIDETLDSTSSNPIQNKAVAEEITSLNNRVGTKPLATQEYVSTAISEIPKPDLTGYATETFVDAAIESTKEEMGQVISSVSKDLQVVDEAGNIVFKVDETGTHTTTLTLNGETAATKKDISDAIAGIDLTDYATEKFVSDAIDAIEFPEPDLSGYVTEGTLTTSIEAAKEELSESIVAETDEWKVADNDGNVIFSVDAAGAHTTNLTLRGESLETLLDDKASKDHTHQIKNNSHVSTTGTTIAFEIEGQTFSQEVAIDGGSMSVESAQKLTTGRSISLSGDVVAEGVLFDGSSDITLTASVKNSEKLANKAASEYALKTDIPDTKDFITMSDVEEKQYLVEADITAKKFVDESSLAAKQYATESFVADELDGLTEDLKQSILLESNEWQVVDENNNIIFKVDAEGTHTTSMTLDGESAATEKFVADSIAAIEFPETDLSNYYTKQETESLIPDTSNFLTEIPEEYVTETELTDKGFLTEHQSLEGLVTTQELEEHAQNSNLHVTSADKQKWNAKSNFSGDYNDLTNAPAVAEDETGDLIIADNAGNIIFRASDQGLETTHLSIGSLTINGMTIQEIVNACVEEALKNQNN